MEEKLARLEEQMKRLISDFHDKAAKNDELSRENERLLNDLLEKNRRLDVLEERGSVMMETEAEKKKLEQQRERIKKEALALLEKVRALKGRGKK